jgi:hypothetical protein
MEEIKMKKYSTILAVVAAGALCMVARANPMVDGSIAFSGSATVFGGTPTSLATATGFKTISATITSDSGDYAAVPTEAYSLGTLHTFPLLLVDASSGGLSSGSAYFTPGLMSDYNFNPPAGSVTPLWAFTYGGLLYTFDATSMMSTFDAALDEWNMGGTGTASITGDATAEGIWNANIGLSGGSFFFGSAASTVPDGGLTVALLGGSLVALCAFRRKLS